MTTDFTRMSHAPLRAALLLTTILFFPAAPLSAQLIGGGDDGGSQIFQLQKGIGMLRKGENEQAKTHFNALALRFPTDPMAPYYLALSNAALGDAKETITALRSSIERGWEKPEDWRKDPGFVSIRKADPTFQASLEALLQEIVDRSEKGRIAPHDLSALTYLDLLESEHTFAENVGRPRAVLFLDGSGDTLTALWSVEALLKEHGDAVAALVLVECRGKGSRAQLDQLAQFQLVNHIDLPIGLATPEQLQALRPWRSFPTLLMLDGKNRASHVVDGFPVDLEDRYRAAFEAVLEQKASLGKENPAPKGGEKTPTSSPKDSSTD